MYKQIYRSQKNKVIAGVAGGIAEYFELDPVIVRAAFIITTLGWGFGFIAYFVLWIIMPTAKKVMEIQNDTISEELSPDDAIRSENRKTNSRIAAGITLIILGAMLFIDKFICWLDFHTFWPLALIILGVMILFRFPRFAK